MLLSKSGPTDICPHPLRAVRPHGQTSMPAKLETAAPRPRRCSLQMLRQILAGVKLS